MIQRWFGDGAAGVAARILAALRRGKAAEIAAELDRAAEICRAPLGDRCAAERIEVLDAIVRELRHGAGEAGADSLEAHKALLAHLAGL